MTITILIQGDYGLRFRAPSIAEMRAAYVTKGKLDSTDEAALLDEVSGQIVPLLLGSTDAAESLDDLKTSGLLWGRTAIGLWMDLYFRDLRSADRAA